MKKDTRTKKRANASSNADRSRRKERTGGFLPLDPSRICRSAFFKCATGITLFFVAIAFVAFVFVQNRIFTEAATQANDTFTDGTVAIENHTPDTGTGWTAGAQGASTIFVSERMANKANDVSGNPNAARENTDIGTAEMDVTLDVQIDQCGQNQGVIWAGPAGAIPSGAFDGQNYYAARLVSTGNANACDVQLVKRVAGAETVLGTFDANITDDTEATLELRLRSGSQEVLVNGVSRITASDTDLSGTFAGVIARNQAAIFDNFISEDFVPPTFTQSAYRFFDNDDSTDVGATLAAQDSAATLGSAGAAFRLRSLVHLSGNELATSGESFKLQFAESDGTCDTGFSGETYADVTGASVIAYNDNATPADGAALTGNANDPVHSGHTTRNQSYEEANNFTNAQSAISIGEDGMWDFALTDNGAPAGTSYCFRIVKSDGSALDAYSVIPEVTTFAESQFNQASFRFFDNADSTDVGAALAAQNAAATLSSNGDSFRLRQLIHVENAGLSTSGEDFKLQFSTRSGSCDTGFSGENYQDVTTGTVLAYNDNPTPADGAALTANAGDPTHGGDTIRSQTYEELNDFTNSQSSIGQNEDGKWDFALIDNNGASSVTYCLRVVKADGSQLDTYTNIPEVTTATGNTAPTGSWNSAMQKTDGSGHVDLSIEADDEDDDDTRAKIEFETDSDGACDGPWGAATLLGPATADFDDTGGAPDVDNGNTYQVGSGTDTRIITSSGPNTVQFDWDSETDLPSADGTQCLRLTMNDDDLDQTTPATRTVEVDNVTPAGGGGGGSGPVQQLQFPSDVGMDFEEGACTTERSVTVTLTGQNISEYLLSNDEFFRDTDWQPYTGSPMQVEHLLTEGDGEKTAYARFRSLSGNQSNTISDTILLDTQTGCDGVEEVPPTEPEDPDDSPEPPGPTDSKVCPVACESVDLDVYIVNPDGSERHTGSAFTHIEWLRPSAFLIRFEDKGVDFDYKDVVVEVDRSDCRNLRFTLREVNASWNHEIRVRLFYEGTPWRDIQLWANSQTVADDARRVSVDAANDAVCAAPPDPELQTLCELDPTLVGFRPYIENPDGTRRIAGTEWVRETRVADGIFLYMFEDKGVDADFEDVWLQADLRDPDKLVLTVVSVNAGWHHSIGTELDYAGVRKSSVLFWEDSHLAVGQTREFERTAFPLLCTVEGVGADLSNTYGVVYEHIGYEGRAEAFVAGDEDPDLADNFILRNTISSLRLFGGVGIRLFGGVLFGGLSDFFTTDIPDLRETGIGHDDAESVLVVREADPEKPAGPGPETQVFCRASADFTAPLAPGDNNTEVRRLQELLQCLGFIPGTVVLNENFGPATERAVRDFQAVNGLQPLGFLTAETREILNRFTDPASPAPPPQQAGCSSETPFTRFLTQGSEGTEVRALQELLQCLGYFPADQPSTAIFGPITTRSVEEFQRENGIEPVGYVGPSTREALNAYSAP